VHSEDALTFVVVGFAFEFASEVVFVAEVEIGLGPEPEPEPGAIIADFVSAEVVAEVSVAGAEAFG